MITILLGLFSFPVPSLLPISPASTFLINDWDMNLHLRICFWGTQPKTMTYSKVTKSSLPPVFIQFYCYTAIMYHSLMYGLWLLFQQNSSAE